MVSEPGADNLAQGVDGNQTGVSIAPGVPSPAPPVSPARRWPFWAWMAAFLVMAGLGATVLWRFTHSTPPTNARAEEPMRLEPLAIPSGMADYVTLSPDGNAAAFSWWSGNQRDAWRICVTVIGSGTMTGVTAERAAEEGNDYFQAGLRTAAPSPTYMTIPDTGHQTIY